MARVFANNVNLAMATNNLALVAHLLDRRTYLHNSIPFGTTFVLLYVHAQPQAINLLVALRCPTFERRDTHNPHTPEQRHVDTRRLFKAVRDAAAVQVVDRQLNGYTVARKDLDIMHAHLSRDVSQDIVAIFELDPKHSVGQGLDDLTLEFDNIVFAQKCSFAVNLIKRQMDILANFSEGASSVTTCAKSPN